MSLLRFNYNNCLNNKNINEYKELINKIDKNSFFNEKIRTLPFLSEVNNNIDELKKLSEKFAKKFNIFCLLGTGGSSIGSQSLIGLMPEPRIKKFNFYYDIDPVFFQKSLDCLNLKETGFIVISKSGSTPETMAQFGALIQRFDDLNLMHLVSENFIIITENKQSPLSFIAKKLKIKILNFNKQIGGRFSIFSNVALFPASIAGIDISKFKKGGKNVLEDLINKKNICPIEGAAMTILMHKLNNLNINVVFTYSESLKNFGMWYRQLWSESLGKNNLGTTPVHSVGTIDQHSQLQLYLDGPKDKFFTIIKTSHYGKGPIIHSSTLNQSGLNYIAGKRIGDLMEAEQNSTLQTLINNNLAVKEIFIKNINAESLGALTMHFFLEVICAGMILNIDILNQPAIEEGKILTKEYLS